MNDSTNSNNNDSDKIPESVMTIALNRIITARQAQCDHSYQDRCTTEGGVYCGRCGQKE